MTTLATLPDNGGVFSGPNLTAINAALTAQNANNTLLAAGTLTGATGLTAHSGGGQGSALALTAGINLVGTVAAIADSVALPTSVAGLFVTVVNDAALSLQAFGASTDTIDDVATATGVSVPGKSTATFFCAAAGAWYQIRRSFLGLQAIAASGAILPHVGATYVITKSSAAAAMTLAAPTATTDDGLIITVTSNTAKAHTITATGLLQTGAATTDVATFAAFAGCSVTLMAYQGKWNVISQNVVTFS